MFAAGWEVSFLGINSADLSMKLEIANVRFGAKADISSEA